MSKGKKKKSKKLNINWTELIIAFFFDLIGALVSGFLLLLIEKLIE